MAENRRKINKEEGQDQQSEQPKLVVYIEEDICSILFWKAILFESGG